ncbi:MAG: BatD family protein [bacterium]
MNKLIIFLIFLVTVTNQLISVNIEFSPSEIYSQPLENFHVHLRVDLQDNQILHGISIEKPDEIQLTQTVTSTSTIIINRRSKHINNYTYSGFSVSGGQFTVKFIIDIQTDGRIEKFQRLINITIGGDSITFKQNITTGANESPILSQRRPVDVKVNISDSTPYPNQQVIVSLDCYSLLKFSKPPQIIYPPSFQGFWVEPLDSNFRYEVIQQQSNNIYHYSFRWAIFPIQNGTSSISEAEIELSFSQYSLLTRDYSITTKPVELQVRPLPTQGIPLSFNGSVGQFFISLDAPDSIDIDSVVEIQAEITGQGNIRGLPNIEFPEVDNANIFYSGNEINLNTEQGLLKGTKTVKWHLIPESPGELIIPPLSFAYYDPSLQNYITTSTSPCTVYVMGSKCYQNEIAEEENDTLTHRSFINIITFPSPPDEVYWATYILSGLIILGSFSVSRLRIFQKNPNSSWYRRKHYKISKQHLNKAKKLLNSRNYKKFYKTLKYAIIEILHQYPEYSDTIYSLRDIQKIITGMNLNIKYDHLFDRWEKIEFSGVLNHSYTTENLPTILDKNLIKKDYQLVKSLIEELSK